MTNEEVIEYLSNLSVLEISKLVKALEEKWGVTAAAPVAVAAAAPAAAASRRARLERALARRRRGADEPLQLGLGLGRVEAHPDLHFAISH